MESDNKKVLEKVKKRYSALDLPFCEEEMDKVHRIGKEYKDKNSGGMFDLSFSSLNYKNYDNKSITPNLELRGRNKVKILLFQSI